MRSQSREGEGGSLSVARRPSNVLIPFIAGIANAAVWIIAAIEASASRGLGFGLVLALVGITYLAASIGVWRRSRVGYVAMVAVSAFAFLFIADAPGGVLGVLGTPTNTLEFFTIMISLPALSVAIAYSVLGFKGIRQKGAIPTGRMIPASTALALMAVGFIIGGAFIGGLAAGTESRLLASSGGGNITIVQGASAQNVAQPYSPSNFTVKVGTTVTWVNKDSTTHTVTSLGSNLFDSGDLPLGASFSYTFTQPGTYQYYCTIHPWMKGTIVVTSG
jgi:plastocyanin